MDEIFAIEFNEYNTEIKDIKKIIQESENSIIDRKTGLIKIPKAIKEFLGKQKS